MTRMERIDWWLNRKVFTRIADWADYHFNRNHYDLAAYCLIMEIVAAVLLTVTNMLERDWVNAVFDAFIIAMLFMFNVPKVKRLEKASREYESSDALVPSAAIVYFIYPPWLRFSSIVLSIGLAFWIATREHGLSHAVVMFFGMSWLMWSGYSDYFAIVLRPPKARQKKKAPDFSGALQPSPVSS